MARLWLMPGDIALLDDYRQAGLARQNQWRVMRVTRRRTTNGPLRPLMAEWLHISWHQTLLRARDRAVNSCPVGRRVWHFDQGGWPPLIILGPNTGERGN